MKKSLMFVFLFLFILVSLLSFSSSEVVLTDSTKEVYNLGDVIRLPLSFYFDHEVSDIFVLSLDCPEGKVEFYKEYLYLSSGERASKTVYVPLIKGLINNLKGQCSVVYKLGTEENYLGDEFKISNKVFLEISKDRDSFNPGESFNLRGKATKENGDYFRGEIKVIIEGGVSENLEISKTVNSGDFNFAIIIPEKFESGSHLVSVKATEFDSNGDVSNSGVSEFFININQVPSTLDLILEDTKVNPGELILFRGILYDQTGERISSTVYFAIRNSESEVIQKIEAKTGETAEYKVEKGTLPGTWSLSAFSNELNQRTDFEIKEFEKIGVELINDTLILTNDGNVNYNKSVSIEIGEEVLEIPLELSYGDSTRYKLSAPNGVYEVSIEGVKQQVSLTGKAIDVKKISSGVKENGNLFLWAFIIIILIIVLIVVFKRGYKKDFFGKLKVFPLPVSKRKKDFKEISAEERSKKRIPSKLPSEISLSIKGDKQNSSVICLSLKNYSELSNGAESVSETLSKIVSLVESSKGFVFSNSGSLFFFFAPSKTKTFRNETLALNISEKIKKIIEEHNKKFKVKFNFGISLNYGTIVTKEEEGKMKFMSMGTLMSDSRKIANLSNGTEILISEKLNSKFPSEIKTEAKSFGSVKAYTVREVIDRKKHDTFIKGFLARQERDKYKN